MAGVEGERVPVPVTCTCDGVRGDGCPCSKCHGAGWYPYIIPGTEHYYPGPDWREMYCDCLAGQKLRERDGVRAYET